MTDLFSSPDDSKVARALVELLTGSPGSSGIADFAAFTQHLAKRGLGKEIESWTTRDQNLPVQAQRLEKALEGTNVIEALCERTKLEKANLLDRLGWVLPRVVHEVTPFGADEGLEAVQLHLQGLRKRLRK